jgi:hypothetical protein
MATKIFPSRPAGRKTKIRRKQAAAAASAPPSPPPAQRPLPQLPRWTLPFLWMSTVSINSLISRFDTQSSLFKLSFLAVIYPAIVVCHQFQSSVTATPFICSTRGFNLETTCFRAS